MRGLCYEQWGFIISSALGEEGSSATLCSNLAVGLNHPGAGYTSPE